MSPPQYSAGAVVNGRRERYGQSKLANILHTKALAKRYGGKENNIIVVALHPGAVRT